jgi:hypothetical protein
MGWFSATIMGGDPPMNWEGDLNDIAGARPYDDKPISLTAKMIDEHLDEMVEFIKKEDDDSNIGWQVLGVMILTTGAKMPIEIRENIVKNIYDENIDGWDKPEDRKFFLDRFRTQVENYKEGHPEEIAHKGVLEVMMKKGAEEKMMERVSVKELRGELGALIKKYMTSPDVKKSDALRDILIDIIHACEKSKVDFYNTAAGAMEIFKGGKK